MRKTIIALAQSASKRGKLEENLQTHQQLIELAAENGAQLIAFPELSLTGYEPDLASDLGFIEDDVRLNPLKELAARHQIIILAGAPFRTEEGLHIAAFILYPNREVKIYTKHYLHPGEEKIFIPGNLNPAIPLGQEKIAVPVCADIANPLHPEDAAKAGCTLYLASTFITPGGYEVDANLLKEYTLQHQMPVMLANYSGNSGGFESAGRSALWSENGQLVGEFNGSGEGLLLAVKERVSWKTKAVSIKEKEVKG